VGGGRKGIAPKNLAEWPAIRCSGACERFAINLTHEDDGRVSVTFDDLPGSTWGKDESEAMANALDALGTALSMHVDDGEPIPAPKAARGRPVLALGALDAAKLALHNAMIAAKMSNVELGRRLNLDEKKPGIRRA